MPRPKIALLPERRRRRVVHGRSSDFNAVVATWMEADIIEATVANLFEQGCDRVFVIDNDSPDDTVERAVDAGAELWCSFASPVYDEAMRLALIRDLMERQTSEARSDVWWLLVDADEFPRVANGDPIRALVDQLDASVDLIGSRYLNHYPSATPANVVGQSPLGYQPLAELMAPTTFCAQGHRKHQLIRLGPTRPRIVPGLGFHTVDSPKRPVIEASEEILLHHFPFRNADNTRARLARLYGLDGSTRRAVDDGFSTAHMRARLDTIDAVYAGRWSDVATLGPNGPVTGVVLSHWTELVTS
ncbi:MAG: glycosyltransferase family 2 protein [Actinomycetota bacterium]